jgi:hypothetical protein
MKRFWKVLRTHSPHPDCDRRGDRVYQLLLEWSAETEHSPTSTQEDADANRDLRSRLDPTPGPDPDH